MMEVGSTFIHAIATLLDQVIGLYIWVVIIAALISWVRPDPYNPIVQILVRLTEPVYAYMRRYIPTNIAGIDVAPIILILVLNFAKLFFINLLFQMAG
jgi:YggT family protein